MAGMEISWPAMPQVTRRSSVPRGLCLRRADLPTVAIILKQRSCLSPSLFYPRGRPTKLNVGHLGLGDSGWRGGNKAVMNWEATEAPASKLHIFNGI